MTNNTMTAMTDEIVDTIILDVDSYKASHYKQYRDDLRVNSSYLESRGGPFEDAVMFGTRMFLEKFLSKPITKDHIDLGQEIIEMHGLPFNRPGWDHILNKHGGYLPLEIKAVAEGSVVPVRNALARVENTDPDLPWLTSYIETSLLRAIWYPTTVCTLSWTARKRLMTYLLATADDPHASIDFMLHDFGARGTTCKEQAAIGGLGHLVNFKGSDTISAILQGRRYYDEPMAGFSIPASEHSTMTSYGRDNEKEAYENMIIQFGGQDKVFACVSDSYDIYNACENIWGGQLKMAVKTNGGRLVVRPDSGNPREVVLKVLEILGTKFGTTTNRKGYKVLPDYIRVIQGDGVNLNSIVDILEDMKRAGWSAENITFGMGGALLQKVDRDTMKWAQKTSAAQLDSGEWIDVYKDPITDPGKGSKRGRLNLTSVGGWKTMPEDDIYFADRQLQTVYKDGEITAQAKQSLEQIRNRANPAP